MSSLIFPLASISAEVAAREPFHDVQVDTAKSGREFRYSWQAAPRYRYKVKFNALRSDAAKVDYQQLAAFHKRHFGQLDSFLLQDPEDYTVTDHGFGVGDGATTAFQLQRTEAGSATFGYLFDGPWPVYTTPRTNIFLYSQAFDNAAWTKFHSSVTPAATLAPDGTVTGEKLVEDNTTNGHYVEQATTRINGASYVFSVYAKQGERSAIELQTTIATPNAVFDLAAGTVFSSGGGTASIKSIGNGWYRCSLAFTAGVSTETRIYIYSGGTSYLGDGTSGVYLWGAQIESGAAPTRYLASTSAAKREDPSYWPSYADGFEPIYDPDIPTLTFKSNGTPVTPTSVVSGLVTLGAAPGVGYPVTFSGSYYRRVRFADPSLSFDRIVQQMWSTGLQLVSLKP